MTYVPYHNSLPLHPLKLSESESSFLCQLILDNEIINSIKTFKPLKTAGPDGIHQFFYQKYIQNPLSAIKTLFNEIFSSTKFPSNLNNTLITLIPKTTTPETINQYQPIGLCNTIYKIFTKILVA